MGDQHEGKDTDNYYLGSNDAYIMQFMQRP